ncbi:MAG: FlgO family outer membrane protein [Elusimicrobiales bacterium]|nr:FlgO family outer membrane protein [Elusimicrobiales bacterium]
MKKTFILLMLLGLQAPVFAAAPAAKAGTSASAELSDLAGELGKGVKASPGIKLAVLAFPYTSEKASEGPVVVQERLTTLLAGNKKVVLIERGLMKKVMEELKLQASGAVDEETVKKLGKMLGADAVVTGTLNDLQEGNCEVNARVVETESGKILAAASALVTKTWSDTGATAVKPPQDYGSKPLVQVAILLDTSNSMDGLINQARSQVWKIVNELVSSEKSGSRPVIEVALYEYGNSTLSAGSGWIRQVLPFTQDLDSVAKELFALRTNGGEEFCGQAIKAAVTELKWSPKTDVYKAIFIAGNEPFTQGTVPYQDAVAKAKAKGIFVNTVYCGARQRGLAEQWKAGADLAEGDYANIDQSLTAYAIAAPQDDRISELSSKLNDTYVAYGANGQSKMAAKREVSNMARSAGKGIAAERAAFQAAAPGAAMADSSWDVVSAVESGAVNRDEIKKEQLPEELKAMDKAALDKYLDGKLAERKKIKEEINRLQTERKVYLAQEEKKQAGANTLDKAMIDTIRRQAVKRGYKFSE